MPTASTGSARRGPYPDARYLPVEHGLSPPSGLDHDHVVMVDFSYPREVIERLAPRPVSGFLDHHVTAQAALAGLPYAYFDMKKSGAVLAWEWAHPEPAPVVAPVHSGQGSVGMAVAHES